MECSGRKLAVLTLVILSLTICYGQTSIVEGVSPLDELPGYIKQVTHFGQRADFSHDGKRIIATIMRVIRGRCICPTATFYFRERGSSMRTIHRRAGARKMRNCGF